LRLAEFREQLEPLFPVVMKASEETKRRLETLRAQREEIENADQEELRRVREELSIVAEGIETRQGEMQVQEQQGSQLAEEEVDLRRRIEECRGRIAKAERVKEVNRGFEKNEVEGFKSTKSLSFP
jgi:chromosome segregation ATPase